MQSGKEGAIVLNLAQPGGAEQARNESEEKRRSITEAKHAEEELRRSEAYLADAQRLTHTGSWAWDPRTQRVLYCSDEMYRIFGLSREHLPTRKRFRERVHPDDRARVDERFLNSLRDKVDSLDEYRIVLPDGTLRYVCSLGHLVFDNTGAMVAFVGTAADVTERKRVEEALRESEYKLRQIIDTVPGLIWSTAPDGEPTHVSQRLLDYSGMRFEDFKHRGWEALVHPADFPETATAYSHAIQTGTSYQGVLRLRRADGEFRWHHARCEPLRDREGRIIQWYGLSVDIADDKKAEEQPRFVAQLQAILNVLPTYTWYAAPSGELTFVNKRSADYLGVPKDHPLRFGIDVGAQWDDWVPLLHPDDREEARKYRLNSLRTGAAGEHSYRARSAQGDYRWFLTRYEPLRASDGTLLLWIGATLDIEDLKCSEQALRESEAKFRDYAETASDWFWETGPDYKITLLTGNAFGSQAADRIGATVDDFRPLDLETEPEKWRLLRTTLDSRKPVRDFVYCRAGVDGSPMYVKASGKPVFDANGEFRGYRGTSTDVTAMVRAQRAEESLRAVQAELAHTSRVTMLGELAATIAHEVKQPIAAARNNTRAAQNFLEKQSPDLDEVRQALACILSDIDRAGHIADRVRDHIKKAPPRKDRLDLNNAILEVIELARSAIAGNGVLVRTQLAEELLPVVGDRVQLQQVVLNLLLNAVEAMSSAESGTRELSISTGQNGTNGVDVSVCDSGPGIDPEHLDRVFTAFYTTKSGGMGMGLSICRSIIDAHGGRLWAEPNRPTGIVFRFTLPVSEGAFTNSVPESRQSEEPHARTARAASRRRISEGNGRRRLSGRGRGQRHSESP